jgi:hypothetical protein
MGVHRSCIDEVGLSGLVHAQSERRERCRIEIEKTTSVGVESSGCCYEQTSGFESKNRIALCAWIFERPLLGRTPIEYRCVEVR